jgi:hypothetical protein
MKSLSVPEQHQKNIAIKTLKMPDAMVGVMGGMDKDEARKFLKSIGYTDAQVRKLEARQASSRVVIAKELVKIVNKKTQGALNMNRIAVAKELVKVAKLLSAGTWSLPNSQAKARALLDIIQQMEKGSLDASENSPTGVLYNYLGDDELFGDIDRLTTSYLKSCAALVKRSVKQFAKRDADDFKDKKAYEALVWLAQQL